jgi:endonuclease YncB( thermonuclease family)
MISATLLVVTAAIGAGTGAAPGVADSHFTGRCLGVSAGDTLLVMRHGQPVAIRVDGIACPPMSDEVGLAAARHTYGLAVGRELSVIVTHRELDGRLAGVIRTEGRDLALELVRTGLAAHRWAERPHPSLAEAQDLAREEGRGIWSPTRGVIEVDLARPPAPEPQPRSVAEVSGGELTDQNVVQDDIVWIWSTSSPTEIIDEPE